MALDLKKCLRRINSLKITGVEHKGFLALSIVEQSMKEVDELAKKFKIPRINSITVGFGRAVASMGDGQLFLNARYFNKFAKDTAKVSPNKLTQKERQEFILKQEQLEKLNKRLDAHYKTRQKRKK